MIQEKNSKTLYIIAILLLLYLYSLNFYPKYNQAYKEGYEFYKRYGQKRQKKNNTKHFIFRKEVF